MFVPEKSISDAVGVISMKTNWFIHIWKIMYMKYNFDIFYSTADPLDKFPSPRYHDSPSGFRARRHRTEGRLGRYRKLRVSSVCVF